MVEQNIFDKNMEDLESNGFIMIKNALDHETIERWKEILYDLYDKKSYDINNSVGNVAFDKLLQFEPQMSKAMIGHESVAPYLKAIMGKQCQLRSFRAHVNPKEYLQEWHMDFFEYWHQGEKSGALKPAIGLCMNTTFYLTDNASNQGRLRFIKEFFKRPIPEEMRDHWGYTDDRTNPFQRWCEEQPHVDLHPNAGDVVLFYSHVPHQGAKTGADAPGQHRANLVLHYQQNPMFPGIGFVSNPQFTLDQLGYAGTFPFAG